MVQLSASFFSSMGSANWPDMLMRHLVKRSQGLDDVLNNHSKLSVPRDTSFMSFIRPSALSAQVVGRMLREPRPVQAAGSSALQQMLGGRAPPWSGP